MGEPTEPIATKNPEMQNQLAPEYAARFLFHSFRHSQGYPSIQTHIFEYAHIIRPGWKIPKEEEKTILEISKKMILSFIGQDGKHKTGIVLHQALPSTNQDGQIEGQLDEMRKAFSEQTNLYSDWKDIITAHIVRDIVVRDQDFLTKENGRERSPGHSEKPLMDPWQSFIVHFGLNRNPTGIAEFDEMYADVRKFIITHLSGKSSLEDNFIDNDDWIRNFKNVLRIYQEKHPGAKIDLSP